MTQRGRIAGHILLGLAALSVGCDAPNYTEVITPDVDVDRIFIQSDAGNVELFSGTRLKIERTVRAREGALDLSQRVEHNANGETVLILEARCAALLTCAVDQKISLPEELPVSIALGEGDIWATGIQNLSAQVSRGAVDVDVRGPLHVQVGNGSVQADLPLGTAASIAVGQGDISLHIPAGPWQLTTQANELRIDDDIRDVTSALGRLELIAPAGAVDLSVGDPVAGL